MNQNDIRYQKTEERLRHAFFEMLNEEGFDNMNVRHLIARAIHQVWADHCLIPKLALPEHYAIAGFTSLISGLIVEWVKSGCEDSGEDLAQVILFFTSKLTPDLFSGNRPIHPRSA